MIKKLEISTQQTELTPEIKKYIHKKLGVLDKYVSRHARRSLRAEVKLKHEQTKNKQQYTCAMTLQLPHDLLEASETTVNMFAAIDIVETKIKQQLARYKDIHGGGKTERRLFARFRRRGGTIG